MSTNKMSNSSTKEHLLDISHQFRATLIEHFEQMRENLRHARRENRLLRIEIAKHAKQDITSLDMTSDIPTNKRKRVAGLCVELNSWQGKLKKCVPQNVLNVIKTHEQKLCAFGEVYGNLEKYEDWIKKTAAAINKCFNQ